jgi:hypothetical protein
MAEAEKKAMSSMKQTRTIKPVYAIMSVTDQNGNVLSLDKENVTIHSVEKSADAVLDALDTGKLPVGSFYKRIALG